MPDNSKYEKHPAVLSLCDLMDAMNAWEQEMIDFNSQDFELLTQTDFDKFMAEQKDRLAQIYEKFCIEGKSAPRLQGPLSYPGRKPDYDRENEHITGVFPVTEEEVIVESKNDSLSMLFRYHLKECGSTWKVHAARQSRATDKSSWMEDMV